MYILENEIKNKHVNFAILDPAKLIKINNLQEITNPIFFVRDGVPTTDGLLSNEIFGITKDERSNIFAYVDLGDWFINPLIYKLWRRMDKRIIEIVHGTKNYIVNDKGDFEPSENGKTGIKFLKENINKIKIRTTESNKRNRNIEFIELNKELIFMKQLIIIPAFYRDVNSDGGRVGVGEINKLYDSIIIAVRALKESAEYGLSMTDTTRGRIQELLLQVYNWFTKEPNISNKEGIIRRAVLTKTADLSSRLVLSAPELKVEKVNDMMVDMDHAAIPLSSLCANLQPYIVFWVRRFFENEFSGASKYPYLDKESKEIKFTEVKDPLIEFSDDRIKKELNRFIFGFSNRFTPIKVPNKDNKNLYMHFKGRHIPLEQVKSPQDGLLRRKLTWCDLFYMAAFECSKDKHALLTRYPIDSIQNQFPVKIKVSSTKETEPMYYGAEFYPHYPKIRENDIESNTSNKFIDTLRISNLMLGAIGGDYDGDQMTCKIAFSIEANKELENYMNSKAFYLNMGGRNMRTSSNEAIQAIYNLTQVLPGTKLVDPIFKK